MRWLVINLFRVTAGAEEEAGNAMEDTVVPTGDGVLIRCVMNQSYTQVHGLYDAHAWVFSCSTKMKDRVQEVLSGCGKDGATIETILATIDVYPLDGRVLSKDQLMNKMNDTLMREMKFNRVSFIFVLCLSFPCHDASGREAFSHSRR